MRSQTGNTVQTDFKALLDGSRSAVKTRHGDPENVLDLSFPLFFFFTFFFFFFCGGGGNAVASQRLLGYWSGFLRRSSIARIHIQREEEPAPPPLSHTLSVSPHSPSLSLSLRVELVTQLNPFQGPFVSFAVPFPPVPSCAGCGRCCRTPLAQLKKKKNKFTTNVGVKETENVLVEVQKG